MKKIIELEDKWKAYKYRTIIFYLFIIVFIIFIVLLGFFIKTQLDRKNVINNNVVAATQKVSSSKPNNNINKQVAIQSSSVASSPVTKIDFVCREVIVDKLTAHSLPSFKSLGVGYYPKDSIFCIQDNIGNNGLIKTENGWVSASNKYSKIVDVNMFVDSGFYKYQQVATNNLNKSKKTDFEEVKVFDKPQSQNVESNVAPTNATPTKVGVKQQPTQVAESSSFMPAPKGKAQKPIAISTEELTDEGMIEFKKADFRNTNDYDTAIDIANYYFKHKDYKNSLRWALNASNADSKGKQKSASWIIYAKSLYLSDKKEQAIDVLTRYVNSTASQDAMDVLNDMKQGVI